MEKIQKRIHEFLKQIVNETNYIGISFNNSGMARVLFRIDSNNILVLGVSRELYWRSPNSRPVREIITIYIAKHGSSKGSRKLFKPDDDPTKKLSGPKK